MKKVLMILCLGIYALAINAQTIHWITFIDTTDPRVGEIDVNTRQILYNRWINVINAAMADKGYTADVNDFYGHQTTPENCKSIVQNLLVSPEDIIVFYYIGHGGRSNEDNGKYPQMWLAQEDESKMIPLRWVHEQLSQKGARLSLTIGMCCNSYTEGVTAKETPTFGRNSGKTFMTDSQIRNIQKLFLGQKGSIIISSSQIGESSSGVGNTDLGDTDFFTYVWVKLFQEMISSGTENTWKSYLDNVCGGVSYLTNGVQNPQYDIYKPKPAPEQKDEQKPAPVKSTHPKINNGSIDNPETPEEYLDSYIASLMDKNKSQNERFTIAAEFKKLFTSDAVVKILNQDGDIVIDSKKASEYIDIISTSKLLLNVVRDEVKYNADDKITVLKVKEYYRK